MIRPGPPWIERGAAPGGIVLHVYSIDDKWPGGIRATLVLVRPIVDVDEVADDTVRSMAEYDGDLTRRLIAADAPIVFVVYDGDTGERLKPEGLADGR